MRAPKDLLAERQEARYVAYVNFLRKKGLYDVWKESNPARDARTNAI